jgi:hypothetical protein
MSLAIQSTSSIAPIAGAAATTATAKAGSADGFSSFLESAMRGVEKPGAEPGQVLRSS